MNEPTKPAADNEPKPKPELTPFQAMLVSLDAAISSIDDINTDLRAVREALR